MKLITGIVNSYGRNVTTKYGDRSVVDVLINGQKEAVWGSSNCHDIVGRHPGERITLGQDSKGKLHIIEHAGSNLADPTNSYPTAPLPSTPKVAIAPPTQPSKDMDINCLIERHASIMAKCVREIKGQLGDVSEETIQKYATSLYIQISRQLEAF